MKSITQNEFSEFVRSMRMSAGLDQDTLASLLKVKESDIKKYEEYRRLPDDPYAFVYDLRKVIKREIQSQKFIRLPTSPVERMES